MLRDSVPRVTQLTFWFFSYMFILTRGRVVWGRYREGARSSCWQKAEGSGVRGQNQSIKTRGQLIPFSVGSGTYVYVYYSSQLKEAAEQTKAETSKSKNAFPPYVYTDIPKPEEQFLKSETQLDTNIKVHAKVGLGRRLISKEYHSRGHRFNSQGPCGGLQPSIFPVYWFWMWFPSWLYV